MSLQDCRDVWIVAEAKGGQLREITLELASEGRKLADKLKEKLCIVALAGDTKGFSEVLSGFGVDRVYYVNGEAEADIYSHVLSQLIPKHNPRLVLIGSTPLGNELGPAIAARNGIEILTECLILRINDRGYLEATKMTHGEKLYATLETPISRPKVVTVRPGSFDLTGPGPARPLEAVTESVDISQHVPRKRYLQFIKGDPKQIALCDAEIVVAAGKGAGDREGVGKVEALAEALGGSVGGTRAAVDQGWLPFERQVGQTGKTVSPRLFVACGISGAFEFIAGMKDSRLIVAINSDAKAPIFKVSNLSLVGDLHGVVPKIIERLKELTRKEEEEG
jgi:electron transfer flavoprotein alpha subunit